MSETTVSPAGLERPRRFHFEWVFPIFVRPRQVFTEIAEKNRGVWQAAIVILMVTTVVRVIVAGVISQSDPMAGQMNLPQGFESYSPEMQAQFMQAAQATTSPVFVYVFPAIANLLGVWIGWLVVGGLLHLLLMLQGGRGGTLGTMNVVAWAGMPYALRDIVRILAMLIGGHVIASPGVSGFIVADATGAALLASGALALLDIYLIWQGVLLVVGLNAGELNLTKGRVIGTVVVTMLLVIVAQAGLSFVGAQFTNLTVMRPFLF